MDGYDITGCEEPKEALCRTSSSTVNASLSGILILAVPLILAIDSSDLGTEIEEGAVGSLVPESVIGDSSMFANTPFYCSNKSWRQLKHRVKCKGDVGYYLNLIVSSDLL